MFSVSFPFEAATIAATVSPAARASCSLAKVARLNARQSYRADVRFFAFSRFCSFRRSPVVSGALFFFEPQGFRR